MDIGTLALAAGFDIYLIVLALVAHADITRFGRTMVVGVIVGFAALVFGEITVLGGDRRFGAAMTATTLVSFALIGYAMWCHRRLLEATRHTESERWPAD
jgi:high-affinity Fe2+/Pb2+ permease